MLQRFSGNARPITGVFPSLPQTLTFILKMDAGALPCQYQYAADHINAVQLPTPPWLASATLMSQMKFPVHLDN
jgi:hypothetical protein